MACIIVGSSKFFINTPDVIHRIVFSLTLCRPLVRYLGQHIGSDNGLLPMQHQAITWTNADLLLIGPSGTKFGKFLNRI